MSAVTKETAQQTPRLFIYGAGIATLTSIGAWLLAPIESRFVSSLTDDPTLVGVTFAVGTAAFSILALVMGRLADKFGRQRVAVWGLGLGVFYPLLYASAANVFLYMGVKVAWAITAVAVGPVLLAFLQDLVSHHKNRGHLMSLMYGAMSLSGAIGHFAGGYIAGLFDLRAPYYLLSGLYFIILLIAIPTLLSRTARNVEIAHQEDEDHGLDTQSLLFGIRYIFKKPILVYYFILNSTFAMNYGIKVMLWPLIVAVMIEDPMVMGTIFAGTGVTAFLILMFSGKVVDRFGVFRGVHLGFSACIVGGFLMALTGSYVWFGVGAALFAVGEAFYGSAQAVLLTDNVSSKHRGELLGVDRILDNLFVTAAMLVSGFLIATHSAQTAWLIFMLILTAAYAIAHIYKVDRIR